MCIWEIFSPGCSRWATAVTTRSTTWINISSKCSSCAMLVQNFDGIVPNFYDPEDLKQGGIHSTTRDGRDYFSPLMAVSITVVFNRNGELTPYGEDSEKAMNLKSIAKKEPGSSYVLDLRQPAG